MTERDNIEAASKRCAEDGGRLLEVQFMAALLRAINSPDTLERMVRSGSGLQLGSTSWLKACYSRRPGSRTHGYGESLEGEAAFDAHSDSSEPQRNLPII
jgi:hypothetical protein